MEVTREQGQVAEAGLRDCGPVAAGLCTQGDLSSPEGPCITHGQRVWLQAPGYAQENSRVLRCGSLRAGPEHVWAFGSLGRREPRPFPLA